MTFNYIEVNELEHNMKFTKDQMFIIVIVLSFIFVVLFCVGIEVGRNQVAERLCSKQQYDFCEIKSSTTVYKIKDSFIK